MLLLNKVRPCTVCLTALFVGLTSTTGLAEGMNLSGERIEVSLSHGCVTGLRNKPTGERYVVPCKQKKFDTAWLALGDRRFRVPDSLERSVRREGRAVARTFRRGDDALTVRVEAAASGDVLLSVRGASAEPGLYGAVWALRGVDLSKVEIIAPVTGAGMRIGRESRDGESSCRYAGWGGWEMPLVILQAKQGCVAIWAEDPQALPKSLRIEKAGDIANLTFESHALAPFKGRKDVASVAWHIDAFRGDWREPARRYQAWMRKAFGIEGWREPAWAAKIGFVVTVPQYSFKNMNDVKRNLGLLKALARHVVPEKTLLNMPCWRTDLFDENYPDYIPQKAFRDYVKAAQKLGFRVMPYTNMLGCALKNPAFERVGKYQVRDPFTLGKLGWHWNDPTLPIRFAYINQASREFRRIFVGQLVNARRTLGVDAWHVDQSNMRFNDPPGLVDGLTQPQGNVRLHRELLRAMPGIALAGEDVDEVSGVLESFVQRMPRKTRRPHPVTRFIYGDTARPVLHYNASSLVPADAKTIATSFEMAEPYGMIPTIYLSSEDDPKTFGARMVLKVARAFQDAELVPQFSRLWKDDEIFVWKTRSGGEARIVRTRFGAEFRVDGKLVYRRIAGVNQLALGGSINGWLAYDGDKILGLDPEVGYLWTPDPPDSSAPHFSYVPKGWTIRETVSGPGLLEARVEPVSNEGVVFDFLERFGEARTGICLADKRDASIAYGARFSAGSDAAGGVSRPCFSTNPPWRKPPTWGSAFAEYRLKLPDEPNIALDFLMAMSDRRRKSDGVTFMVAIDGKSIFSRHTNEKKWQFQRVGLGEYRGKEVTIRFTSHIGPAHDCSWDLAIWGHPVIRRIPARPQEMTLAAAKPFDVASCSDLDATITREAAEGQGVLYRIKSRPPFGVFFASGQPCVVKEGDDLLVLPHQVGLIRGPSYQPISVHRSGEIGSFTCGGVEKRGINAHPPNPGRTLLSWILKMPSTPLKLHFAAGLRDGTHSKGLAWRVRVNGLSAFEHRGKTPGWRDGEIDLSPYRDRTIWLLLETDSLGKWSWDWAVWADLKLVRADQWIQ